MSPSHKTKPDMDDHGAVFSGLSTGLGSSDTGFAGSTLANAQKFASILTTAPRSMSAAQTYFSFSRKSFYRHLRAMVHDLDGTKVGPGKKHRDRRNQVRGPTGLSPENQLLAKALRLIRIFMQMEIIPLALKLDCSASQIWHIESCGTVIQPLRIEEYAKVFCIAEKDILGFAVSLGTEGANHPAKQVQLFVDICLNGRNVPGTLAFEKSILAGIRPKGVKLSAGVAQQMRKQMAAGAKAGDLAEMYGVSRHTIYDIKAKRIWKDA